MDCKKYTKVNLLTVLQDDECVNRHNAYPGVLSMVGPDSFRFEEATNRPHRSNNRNPKIYEGRYISMVHMRNGRYHVHMRTITASPEVESSRLAFDVYAELLNALNTLKS